MLLCYDKFMAELIPFEKSKKVIRMCRRGRKRRFGWQSGALAALAALCALYCLFIGFFMGYGTYFFLIWGVLGCGFGAWSWLLYRRDLLGRIPLWLRRVFLGCAAALAVLFVVTEELIFTQFNAEPAEGADYCIVLGAQWKESGPSYVLQKRLDAAVTYLNESPETICIVSGGQGANEPIAEADGMAEYLIAQGIDGSRILRETKSTDTRENLVNSAAYCDVENASVVLVTNNFHMYRALLLAEKLGYGNVEGLAAGSYPAMLPNNLLREFLGILKDTVL